MGDVVPDSVRSVGLFGHGGCGKTTLAETLLFKAGALDRRGRVDDGTSNLDQEPEEHRRHISLSLAVGSALYQGKRLYLIDTPGYLDFVGEALAAQRVVDLALLVVDAASPVEVGAELAMARLREAKVPCMVFVNKLERENADPEKALAALREAFGENLAALTWPIGLEGGLRGAYAVWKGEGYGADDQALADIPEVAGSLREQLSERVAEADDEALARYLDEGDLPPELLVRATREAIAMGSFVPVLFGSAQTLAGTKLVLDAIAEFGPAARAADNASDEPVVFVFKTTADQHVGRLSFFRVVSGRLRPDAHLHNLCRGKDERVGQIYRMRGRLQDPVTELVAGEIGSVAKLSETQTGDTLALHPGGQLLPPIAFEEPVFRMSLKANSAADDDHLPVALHRLLEEDPTLRIEHPSGHETVVAGLGEMQLEVLHDRLRRKFSVDVAMELPEVPYRETLRGNVRIEGKHKKQSGGHGQYGHVWLELSPADGEEFVFEDKIFGGVVPQQYRPAVEKGVQEAMAQGVLAGYPVVGVRCALVDGSYHSVDSSEMAFKVAGALAFREGAQRAKPALLEPIDEVEIDCPEAAMGDIIGVLNRKRGRVLGMETDAGRGKVRALVPQAELQRYAIELRSLAGGRARFTQRFALYDEVPAQIAQQIIQKAKAGI
ncbi:MAG: elongation factor G [Thermaerobacter sp.]|nr:elongation factor G [Thermaerobacter sp.]